jgi:hypothetical protein
MNTRYYLCQLKSLKRGPLRPFMVKYHQKKRNFGLARLIREPGDMQKFVGRKFILNL